MVSKLWQRTNAHAFERGWGRGLLSPAFLLLAFLVSLLIIGVLSLGGIVVSAAVIGLAVLTIVLILRQDEIAVVLVLCVQLYIDFYIGYRIFSLILVLLLLVVFYLHRSPQRPWCEPANLWLWGIFLALTIFPAARGALDNHDFLVYYPDVIFGAFIMFWLGTIMAHDATALRRLFQSIALLGTLVAVHTIIESTTGHFLLGLPQTEAYVSSFSNFQLGVDLSVHRAESFLLDPNWNASYLTVLFFIALGLFIGGKSWTAKIINAAEIVLLLIAVLLTYSASALAAVGAGIVVFVLLAGNIRSRVEISVLIGLVAAIMLVGFSGQISLLFLHATDPSELQLRNAVWQTALRLIKAFPLTGIGLGHQVYLQVSEHYRVAAQTALLDHPHNSYLELGAMAGLPVLFLFLLLLAATWWRALRNWIVVEPAVRTLIGAGIAATVAVGVNSWSNQGWTLPPLAGLAWLILGGISSPLLRKDQHALLLKEKQACVKR